MTTIWLCVGRPSAAEHNVTKLDSSECLGAAAVLEFDEVEVEVRTAVLIPALTRLELAWASFDKESS